MAERYWDSPVKSPSRNRHVHAAVTVKLMTERADPPRVADRSGSQPQLPAWGPVSEPWEKTDRSWAAAAYLSAAVLGFLAPLAIYLFPARHSPSLRRHAAQATNVAITFLLYLVCAAVISAALAISSASAGLWTGVTAALLLWIAMAVHLVRAALAARNGSFYRIPDWLCATLLRPER
jgi:uncharacterized Tic20 family protein